MYFNRVLEYQEQHRVENVRRKILYYFRRTSDNKYGAHRGAESSSCAPARVGKFFEKLL